MAGVWAVRLGSYLIHRVHKAGKDSRFDEVKHQPLNFLVFWVMQVTYEGLRDYLLHPGSFTPGFMQGRFKCVMLTETEKPLSGRALSHVKFYPLTPIRQYGCL
jgi:hypothetical protein